MRYKILLVPSTLVFAVSLAISTVVLFKVYAADAPEDSQEMSDFSLSGFSEKGAKAWDVKGRSADIGSEIIKLYDIISNFYGEEETIHLTAKNGNFNRREGNIHLEDNVVVTTSSGTRLLTDALDWDRKRQVIETAQPVKVYKGDMTVTGIGAKGFPDLNKLNLEKDVAVNIEEPPAQAKKRPVA